MLGTRIGRFRQAVVDRLSTSSPAEVEAWLRREYALDESSARNLVAHVRAQLDAVGVISSDTTIVVESFQNPVGDGYVVIHSPFGGRVNGVPMKVPCVCRRVAGPTETSVVASARTAPSAWLTTSSCSGIAETSLRSIVWKSICARQSPLQAAAAIKRAIIS